MPLYMLDTDIASYLIRGTSDALNVKFAKEFNSTCISAISAAELHYGGMKKNSKALIQKINVFCELVVIKEWTSETSLKYAAIRAYLEKNGNPLESMDMLIAASAIAEKAILITNNEKHFSRIPGLKIENWLEQ